MEGNSSGEANLTSCSLHCLEAEYGKFAQDCKRQGGLFKCCVLGWVQGEPHSALANLISLLPLRLRLEKFESLRSGLKKYHLIKNGPTEGSRRCGRGWGLDGCMVCLATHACAKMVTLLNQLVLLLLMIRSNH